jgi:hypothetical protein
VRRAKTGLAVATNLMLMDASTPIDAEGPSAQAAAWVSQQNRSYAARTALLP